ncbi:tRNA (adenosine(37)-N6)-threonylcarbamoyltransferase complex ATPase subunit type 1 TsaE [Pelagibacterium lentulum]|uniref:tRNA threonylcarbamoyladenosine biosynthesis protein TsaE n=1 Tax=Pelagibacterium lentulum TaxID=2029865 RepID=A0A916R935_9HYPH|nr:tRNA (adenosine(37)-N6)-threonylcarbamoyltransferase complex ATPase subunit type 1 TsaE [Pelagibacterium lentulum]GGA42172.1 tRNA (adenosine(37)-N6)-threonylcarbamoyltransferase complex ATPase subunit type 1 TsaE [Pelagibacterium lentulum]
MAGITLLAIGPEQTDAIGTLLARHLVAGDVVLLEGELGAGKSALARAIIRARLDAPGLDVPSPSFAIVQPYPGIVHADLYRISDETELDELGLLDDEDQIVLVEWPSRAPGLAAFRGLTIEIDMLESGAGRMISIKPRAGRDMSELAGALRQFQSR